MNQLILQGFGSFRRTPLASKHGVNCLDVSVAHLLVFFASDVGRTQDDACTERLTQKVKTGI
ncbi:MAG: hypothetical protein DMG42_19920 [Acidobacteria bacterium]|nr:MAG: hypothetical protein DMG42_19920 [Acidobacteriota bacterium]